ncbi:thioredoxin-like protein [Xylona heveae TC161]|uniref:Glutathione peroxidase n=1 Tax=Xylona heveae (strain CBS 132557 / TC161) TaxID=1328760 RepID=A0A165HI32_XYLHT|nr:thioredoxin-like protein [Xylona heveae TC161]KZF23552.1 thioredoxin-like protein [Xylona heveae TC161]
MQASRSLFQAAIRTPISRSTGAPGIKKSYPFLNVWSYSPSPTRTGITSAHTRTMASATSFYDFKPLDKKGQPFPLSKLEGKVVLVVNTASKCGFTPQFAGLEKLYQTIKARHPDSFEILGFPCNQFMNQDPGNNDDIQSFCQVNYGVSFPVLAKTDVNGDKSEPVWEWLKAKQPGVMGLKRVKWNFEKFLIGADGVVKGRWASTTKPESLESVIESEFAVEIFNEGKSGDKTRHQLATTAAEEAETKA